MDEISEQTKKLLDQAAAKPMSQDPMNMVGFGSMLLAAKMFELRAKQKIARGEALDYGKSND